MVQGDPLGGEGAAAKTGQATGGNADHYTGSRYQIPKMLFPKFYGEYPRIWKDHCMDYFIMFNVQPSLWLTAATMHLEGNAAHWYQAYKLRNSVTSRNMFISAVEAKFGSHDHMKFMQDLLALKQKGMVEEYCNQFQDLMYKIAGQNPYYDETLFVAQFLKGLKYEIRIAVASQVPETVDRAMLLARVQQDLQGLKKPWGNQGGPALKLDNHIQKTDSRLLHSKNKKIVEDCYQ
jgi:hypothetical protein